MSELIKVANAKVQLVCTVEGETWTAAQEAAFKKLAKNVEVKGFRKGTAPKNIVKKYIPKQSILLEAAESVAQKNFEEAVNEHNVELIDRPELGIKSIDETKVVLTFDCAVKPDVTLGEYKGLGYKPKRVTVKETEIDEEVKKVQERKAELELKEDGVVENGDTVVIDYEGFKDGVAFEGGKADNYDLVIGSNTFIPGFEDALLGMKAEEEKDINLTFPEDYHAEELKGAAVVFKVKVHEIKTKVLPELDEELIKELKYDGVTNMEELRAFFKKNLKEVKTNQAETEATNELMDKLAEAATVEIPEIMVNQQAENIFNDYANNMMQQGLSMDQYFQFTGSTKEDLMNQIKPDAEKQVKMNLILEAIAKAESLTVSDEEAEAEFTNLSTYYGMPVDQIKVYIPVESVKEDLLKRKAIEFVKNN